MRHDSNDPGRAVFNSVRIGMGLMGLVPMAIGILVIIFVWSQDGDFPPVFFKIFASIIGLGFIGFGFLQMMSLLAAGKAADKVFASPSVTDDPAVGTFKCTHCSAPYEGDTVEPGPLQCRFCDAWFDPTQPRAAD